MARIVKCAACGYEYLMSSKGVYLKCPNCDTVHIEQEPESKKKCRGFIWILAGLLVIALIIVGLKFFPKRECNELVIKEVRVDPNNLTIHIVAKASSPFCKLTYSIDNNKSGAYRGSKFSDVQAGQYYICVIYGEGPDDRIMWHENPVIMPESELTTATSPPQVIGVDVIEPTHATAGMIIVHAESSFPLEYSLNDSIVQDDSVFNQVMPGPYIISVIDSLGRTDTHIDTVFMPALPEKVKTAAIPCSNPDKNKLEARINSLFSDKRGDRDLQNQIFGMCASRNITVEGTLINTNAKYSIYSYLQRQNFGPPGSIKVRVNNLKYNEYCKITYIELEEYSN